jgi:hypothetical protein
MSKGFDEILARIDSATRRLDDTTQVLMGHEISDEQLALIAEASYRMKEAANRMQRMANQRNDRWHQWQKRQEVH